MLAQSTTTVPRAVDGRMAPFLPLAAAPALGRALSAEEAIHMTGNPWKTYAACFDWISHMIGCPCFLS